MFLINVLIYEFIGNMKCIECNYQHDVVCHVRVDSTRVLKIHINMFHSYDSKYFKRCSTFRCKGYTVKELLITRNRFILTHQFVPSMIEHLQWHTKYLNSKGDISLPIITFLNENILRNKHTYIMINASNVGMWIECWRTTNTTLVYLLSNYRQALKYFKTNPLNIIFDDFSIWLLG